MRTSNPVLNPARFNAAGSVLNSNDVMTFDGAVNKSLLTLLITLLAAGWTWNDPSMIRYYLPLTLVSLVIGIVISFKAAWSPILVPLYAALYGTALGSISMAINIAYPGLVTQAVGLTLAVALCMLAGYKTGWLRVTDTFRSTLIAATTGIAFFYLIVMLLSLFGISTSLVTGNGMFSIGLSIFVVGVAALNLVLDFDFIAQGSQSRSLPAYMEWYSAFGLLVTLVWLYWEILNLLIKLNSKRD